MRIVEHEGCRTKVTAVYVQQALNGAIGKQDLIVLDRLHDGDWVGPKRRTSPMPVGREWGSLVPPAAFFVVCEEIGFGALELFQHSFFVAKFPDPSQPCSLIGLGHFPQTSFSVLSVPL